MCGRYTVISDDDIVELRMIIPGFRGHISLSDEQMLASERIVSPGMEAPILTQHGDFMNAWWGFKKWDGKGVVFNARMETIESSRFFSPHLKLGRCVAPALNYFEWAANPESPKKKLKYRISGESQRVIYLCALMRPIEGRFEYTVITRPASPEINYIHPRMPLLLDIEGAKKWLESPELSRLENNIHLNGVLTG
jgi:putative SOS response-associated peptidase YedK